MDFIIDRQDKAGMPPTVREIAEHFGFKSPNNARQHLELIEKKGCIKRDPGKARGIHILCGASSPVAKDGRTISVPLVGTIAAGTPVTAVENIEGTINLDRDLFRSNGLFALRVKGDSMKDVGIMNGDMAVIKQQASVDDGEIAAVMVDEEATLKRFVKKQKCVILKAENPAYKDLMVGSERDVSVLGKLVGIIRRMAI